MSGYDKGGAGASALIAVFRPPSHVSGSSAAGKRGWHREHAEFPRFVLTADYAARHRLVVTVNRGDRDPRCVYEALERPAVVAPTHFV